MEDVVTVDPFGDKKEEINLKDKNLLDRLAASTISSPNALYGAYLLGVAQGETLAFLKVQELVKQRVPS